MVAEPYCAVHTGRAEGQEAGCAGLGNCSYLDWEPGPTARRSRHYGRTHSDPVAMRDVRGHEANLSVNVK